MHCRPRTAYDIRRPLWTRPAMLVSALRFAPRFRYNSKITQATFQLKFLYVAVTRLVRSAM
jgi:hypothetical protein